MNLREYITRHKRPMGRLAAEIGVSRQMLRLYLIGERSPRLATMQRIHEATDGLVTANDFLPLTSTPRKEGARA